MGKADSARIRSKRGNGKGAVRCIAWLDLLAPISPAENEHDNGKSTANDRCDDEHRGWKSHAGVGAAIKDPIATQRRSARARTKNGGSAAAFNRRQAGRKSGVAPMRLNARMAARRRSDRSVPLIRTRSCARSTRHAGPAIQARVPQNADR